jgi:DNA-binding protein YbaB
MTLGSETLASLEAARARVMAQTERARAAALDAERMVEDVSTLTQTATSPGREVSVTARADGSVDRLEVAPHALDLDAHELSRLLTDTVRKAQRAAATSAVQRMAESLGTDSPLVEDIRAQVAAQFGPEPGTDLR